MDEIITRRQLDAVGWTNTRIRRAERTGELTRLRRGVWAGPMAADPRADHCLAARAALLRCGPDTVVSHVSAAILWGLPTPSGTGELVWVTRDHDGGGRLRAGLHLVRSPLDPSEVVELDGLPVTSLARTANDCARLGDFRYAVMVSDAALRRGCPPHQLHDAVARATRWPGNATARRAAEIADARSESPYESSVRAMLHERGLTGFTPQYVVRDDEGRFVARVDLALARVRLAVEFDGEGKYDELLAPHTSPQEAFRAEKRREAALVDAGWHVLRLTKQDVHDEARFTRRMLQAIQRAERLARPLSPADAGHHVAT